MNSDSITLSTVELEEVLIELKNEELDNNSELLVYNDDINTFDWVIQCFMEICNHSFVQAEQLSLLVHYKGKATVKTGNIDRLKPLKNALVDRGLSAVINTIGQRI